MFSNSEIRRLFVIYAELLLLHEKDERLAGLLSAAAYRTKRIDDTVMQMGKKELSQIFRPEIVALIEELKNTNTVEALEELIQLTPAGLFEMMRIKGLAGKKLSVLWKTAKIDTIDGLLEAAKKGKLRKIRGFGAKTEQNIIESIENYFGHKKQFHYAVVADAAHTLILSLQKSLKTKFISLCGEIRRQALTVDTIEILTAATPKSLAAPSVRRYLVIESSNKQRTKAHTLEEIPVTVYHTTAQRYYYDLFSHTGSEAHVSEVMNELKKKRLYSSEEAIYKQAGYPYIIPEMRENVAEWDFSKQNDELITDDDIKGVVHNHTRWSDGVHGLTDFVNACKKKGYEYAVISDHSKNAHYAGGLKEEKLYRQLIEIDKLNEKLKPFKILKSIECDILVSGELDFGSDVLKKLDLVIVSIHQLLKMDEERATKRLIRAIENPYTTILGHMTGRKLLIRPGYPVNSKKIIDACAANKVIIEINANPYRLDMDWSHLPYALEKGVMISINPDAHSIGEIENIRWGVSAARKGGLTKDMTWNAMPLKKIEQWLKKRKQQRRI